MEARETSGITMHAIVRLVAQRGGQQAVSQVLARVGAAEDADAYLDKRRWWSYHTKISMFAAAAEVTGDEGLAMHVAQAVLDHSVGTSERLALSLTGGPGRLLRLVAKAGGKFSTVADMRALRVTRDTASVEYRLHDGYPPDRFDCDYTRGLLVQVPVVFGLPPAEVTHRACQVQGAESCRFEVSWRPARRRWAPVRRASARDGLLESALLGQLERLQSTVAELVAARDPALALATVADRAGYAVNAHAFLLAARPSADAPIQVHSFGLSPAEQAAYTDEPIAPPPGPHSLVARIASAQHDYGFLVAFGRDFFATDQELLSAYANLAAVTLDTLGAVATAAARLAAFTLTSGDTDYLTTLLDRPDLPQIHDRRTDDAFIRAVLDEFELESMAVVAIALPDRFYGMIVASFDGPDGAARVGRFTVELAGAANQAATVLRSLELLEDSWRQAHVDPLTGIPNRRAFMAALDAALAGDGALLFIDLDGFKGINDSFGHAAGDRLLIVVAERLSAGLRHGELVARLAGDEFVVLAPGLRSPAELTELADRVSTAFGAPIVLGDTATTVRASIGTALFTAGQDCQEVLHRADAAMYRAKREPQRPGLSPEASSRVTALA
jgi:diguanylate cyclase (GGDEF)-like protein